MKKLSKTNNCNPQLKEWPGERFWKRIDRLMVVFDHPAYMPIALGLLLVSAVLEVVITFLR